MTVSRHIRRELVASAWIMLPYIVVLNILMFGSCIFQSAAEFGKSFFYSGFCLVTAYFVFRSVAMFIRMSIPAASDLFKRIAIMLPVFYVMTLIMVSSLFSIYEKLSLLNCPVRPGMLWWAIVIRMHYQLCPYIHQRGGSQLGRMEGFPC